MQQNPIPASLLDTEIDHEVIRNYFGDDLQHYESVLKDFLSEAPFFRKQLQDQWQAGAVTAMREIVHRFKPLYHYVGLLQAYNHLQQFENDLSATAQNTLGEGYAAAQLHLEHAIGIVGAEQQRLQKINTEKYA